MSFHPLGTQWMFWAHLPHDIDWSMASYIPIMKITYVEELITLAHTLPDKLVSSCMLFYMRGGIHPTWEDVHNRGGGCFSYKIANKSVPECWKDLSYAISGETLSDDAELNRAITGMSISPKKGFCILKIWMTNCSHQNPTMLKSGHLKAAGCIFKRHNAA